MFDSVDDLSLAISLLLAPRPAGASSRSGAARTASANPPWPSCRDLQLNVELGRIYRTTSCVVSDSIVDVKLKEDAKPWVYAGCAARVLKAGD